MSRGPVCVGIDVAKAELEIALRPTAEGWRVANNDPGVATLVAVWDNPVLHICYDRLRRASKAPKVALTACMRKLLTILNAMIKHRTPWQQNYAPNS